MDLRHLLRAAGFFSAAGFSSVTVLQRMDLRLPVRPRLSLLACFFFLIRIRRRSRRCFRGRCGSSASAAAWNCFGRSSAAAPSAICCCKTRASSRRSGFVSGFTKFFRHSHMRPSALERDTIPINFPFGALYAFQRAADVVILVDVLAFQFGAFAEIHFSFRCAAEFHVSQTAKIKRTGIADAGIDDRGQPFV